MINIITDTSTIAIFDPEVLRYKMMDDGDWWTNSRSAELLDVLSRKELILVDTGQDGLYSILVRQSTISEGIHQLICRSGHIVVVCGEELPGDGLMPEMIRGGICIDVGVGLVGISYAIDGYKITIHWSLMH